MLTEVAELAGRLAESEPLTVLDVRWRIGGPPAVRDYERSHVAGGRFVDLAADLAGPGGVRGRHPLPGAADFGAAMRRLGVSASVPVVVYDAGESTSAARCWWVLEYFGHEDVSILDGGFAAWEAAGGPTEEGAPPPAEPGDFEAVPGRLGLLEADGAARLARAGVLLDARPAVRYRGEEEPFDAVAGHIPGAVSAPFAENLGGDGRFRPADELRERFARLGIPPEGGPPVGVYCGSGITAAQEVFALRLAGHEAALYVGSWSEWAQDPSRPVASGPQPG